MAQYYNSGVGQLFTPTEAPVVAYGETTGYPPYQTPVADKGYPAHDVTLPTAIPTTAVPVGRVGQFLSSRLPNFYQGLKQDYSNVKAGYEQDKANTKQLAGQVGNNWNQLSIGERANTLLGTVGSVMQAYNGYKAGKMAQKQYEHAVNAFNKNWEAQRQNHNQKLEDRQQRRVLEGNASGRAVTSVGDYMNKWGVR